MSINVSISASITDSEGNVVTVRGLVGDKFNPNITIVSDVLQFVVNSQELVEAIKTVVDFQVSRSIPIVPTMHEYKYGVDQSSSNTIPISATLNK